MACVVPGVVGTPVMCPVVALMASPGGRPGGRELQRIVVAVACLDGKVHGEPGDVGLRARVDDDRQGVRADRRDDGRAAQHAEGVDLGAGAAVERIDGILGAARLQRLRRAARAAVGAEESARAREAAEGRQRAALELELVDGRARSAAETAHREVARADLVERRAGRRRAGDRTLHGIADPAAELVDFHALRADLVDDRSDSGRGRRRESRRRGTGAESRCRRVPPIVGVKSTAVFGVASMLICSSLRARRHARRVQHEQVVDSRAAYRVARAGSGAVTTVPIRVNGSSTKRWSMFTLCVVEPVFTSVTRLMSVVFDLDIERRADVGGARRGDDLRPHGERRPTS